MSKHSVVFRVMKPEELDATIRTDEPVDDSGGYIKIDDETVTLNPKKELL